MVLCPHCMNMTQPGSICSHCGSALAYQAGPCQLPAGTILTDGAFRSYEIGAVKGQGGFGITYVAMDLRRKFRVAIKEYYPQQCAQRIGIQVAAVPGMEQIFAGGQSSFLKEAKMLAALPPMDSVVQIMDYFEVNGTAYIAMEYLDGTPLHRMVQNSGLIDAEQLIPRLGRLLQNLKQLHAADIIHRDISPDNIMWMTDGSLKLLDFGSARHLEDGKSVSIQLKHGFAPVEQYLTRGQGPFTDIYALCATVYYCLTGRVPPHAAQRLEQDELIPPSQCGIRIPMEWEEALMWGLTIQPKARPQDVDNLLRRMFPYGVPEQNPFRSEAPPEPAPAPEPEIIHAPSAADSACTSQPTEVPGEPAYNPHKYQRKPKPAARAASEQPITGTAKTRKAIPAATKIIIGAAAIIVILLIILVSLLSDRKNEPEIGQKPAPAAVTEQEAEPVPEKAAAEEAPAPEPEPEPEPQPEEPEEQITEDGFVIELTDGNACVVGYRSESPEVYVPEEAFGCPVTTIASGAFSDTAIMSLCLPSSVTRIESGAFTNCTELAFLLCDFTENTISCEDQFEGCGKLMLILVPGADLWQGHVPDTAILCWPRMETPAGTLEDLDFLEDGCLYGITPEENIVLLKADPTAVDLVMADDCDGSLVYILDGALDGVHDLKTITLTDQVYYSTATFERLVALDTVTVSYNSISFAWYASCSAASNANQVYGKALTQPDMELSRIAHSRAAEIAEDFTEDRPDGSRWITILEDYDCTNCMQLGGRTDNEERIIPKLEEHVAEFAEGAYDEHGNPYTHVGFGITMKDGVYYYIFFYCNNT